MRLPTAWSALLLLAAALVGQSLAADAVRIAEGVYVLQGAPGEASSANQGRISNLAFVLGQTGVVALGTGTSRAEGERLIDTVRRLTGKPVVLAINTHASADHVLGNGAFARRGIPVLAHAETDRFMVQNCTRCIQRLADALGAAPLNGTEMSRPTRLIDGSETIIAGGRRLEILHLGHTFQPGAIAVFDPASRVLFAGELAAFGQIPDLHNADVRSWLLALEQLKRLQPRHVIPAHGPTAAAARLDDLAAYLRALLAAVAEAYAYGMTLEDATRRVELPAFRHWALYDVQHSRNVHHVYLELEAEDLAR